MNLNDLMHSPDAAHIQVVISAKDLRDCFESWMNFAIDKIRERDEPSYYSREELLEVLHVTDPTLNDYRKRGLIPHPIKIGGKVLYDKAKVQEAIESGRLRLKPRRISNLNKQ